MAASLAMRGSSACTHRLHVKHRALVFLRCTHHFVAFTHSVIVATACACRTCASRPCSASRASTPGACTPRTSRCVTKPLRTTGRPRALWPRMTTARRSRTLSALELCWRRRARVRSDCCATWPITGRDSTARWRRDWPPRTRSVASGRMDGSRGGVLDRRLNGRSSSLLLLPILVLFFPPNS